ncbi:MAG TPA: tetratricopeptide repeat protein [Planctomycetaceae bacterium]|nr:tetratricopeptide repeat protein [Planctomycetaceae bacterium]
MKSVFLGLTLIGISGMSLESTAEQPKSKPDTGNSSIQKQIEAWNKESQRLTDAIEKSPQAVDLYSRRGDLRFFLGEFEDSVADYEQMVKLDPSLTKSHWRRGIALFYAGSYKEAAAQFDSYHSFDNVDRENGIWRYFSHYKAFGKEQARKELLKYEKDDREPFPSVYKLFAGEMTGEQIMTGIDSAKLPDGEREKRLFYAHLYIGLNHALEGDREKAKSHLNAMLENTWGPEAGYGPHYMWQVGRVHLALLDQNDREKDQESRPDGREGNGTSSSKSISE